MKPTFSRFGKKLCSTSGISELMVDLGRTMAGKKDVLMLGGGNPAAIQEAQALWRSRMKSILRNERLFDAMLCNYDVPQGRPALINAVVKLFNTHYQWNIGPENVAVTNGSQNAFFYIFNMLAGPAASGEHKKILVPFMPEYIGYADQGLEPGMFRSFQPAIEFLEKPFFKYHVDFEQCAVDDDVAAIVVSRPTNPTGNVLTDREVSTLLKIAEERNIYLIIDNAYGYPFPNIIFSDVSLFWKPHMIMTFTLSKLGLPGTRTGITIASKEVIRALSSINAIAELATGTIGSEIVTPLIESGEIIQFSRSIIRSFYAERARNAMEWFTTFMDDSLPVYLHTCEGALFFWIWCKDLPISSKALYERLKERNVIVVPGCYFFYGLTDTWQHRHECIRINYSQPEHVVRPGLKIIAEEIRKTYQG